MIDRVKNIKNEDIIAALCNEQNAVPLQRAIRYTDAPKNKNGTKKDFHFLGVADAVIVEYERMEADL